MTQLTLDQKFVERYGSAALRAEATHPGFGIRAMSSLGQDGAGLVVRMNKNQAGTFGRHLDDIAKLPPAQKQGVVDLIYRDMERMVQFMGRFIENNPGWVLFTASTTTIERIVSPVVDAIRVNVIPVIAAALGVYFGIRIWLYWRHLIRAVDPFPQIPKVPPQKSNKVR